MSPYVFCATLLMSGCGGMLAEARQLESVARSARSSCLAAKAAADAAPSDTLKRAEQRERCRAARRCTAPARAAAFLVVAADEAAAAEVPEAPLERVAAERSVGEALAECRAAGFTR